MAAFASEQLGITIDTMALPDGPSKPWDAILSCYTMAYVDQEGLRETLQGLYSAGHPYLILMEPMGQGDLVHRGVGALSEWHHNYLMALAETGWELLWRWPVLPPADGLNTLIIAVHKGEM